MRRSVRYSRFAEDLAGFLDAYTHLLGLVRARGLFDSWGLDSPLDVLDDPEGLAAIGETEFAAGRALPAARASGTRVQLLGSVVNPLGDWRNSFIRGHPLTTSMVINYVRQLVGMYTSRAEQALILESGLVGLVARFVRFPSDVREAAGLRSTAGARGAFIVAVGAQVVAGLILAGVLALIGLAASGRL